MSSTMGFLRKGGDGTTVGNFVFAINVNRFPQTEAVSAIYQCIHAHQ